MTLYAGWSQITAVEDHIALNLNVYPNPFVDRVHINGAEGCHLQVFATNGLIVLNVKITDNDETVQLGHLPSGLYIFRFVKDHQEKTFKLVKD